jgi:hypothetical protein
MGGGAGISVTIDLASRICRPTGNFCLAKI